MTRPAVALLLALVTTAGVGGQAPAPRPALTGTVIAVNQQSDSVTLIDLKTMTAYRHVRSSAGRTRPRPRPTAGPSS